jgi:hypothetical protein
MMMILGSPTRRNRSVIRDRSRRQRNQRQQRILLLNRKTSKQPKNPNR